MAKRTEVEAKLATVGVYPDRLIVRKGIYTMRHTFFYTGGKTSQQYADQIAKAGYKVIEHREVWQPWPKDSYWEVIFQDAD